jgi:hypothetical protein
VFVQKMACEKGEEEVEGEMVERRVPRRERPDLPEVQLKINTFFVLPPTH